MTEQWELLERKLCLVHLFTLTIYKEMKWLTKRGIDASITSERKCCHCSALLTRHIASSRDELQFTLSSATTQMNKIEGGGGGGVSRPHLSLPVTSVLSHSVLWVFSVAAKHYAVWYRSCIICLWLIWSPLGKGTKTIACATWCNNNHRNR